jgi:glycosyltransferase involved in cell wall biosynthesis
MISANVISGPFYEVFAEAALASIVDIVDEIIIVDTAPGENPNTEVNEKYATKLLYMPRGESKDFSFSAARDMALRNSSGDWIMKWDQDEVVHEKDAAVIKAATLLPKYSAIELAFYHFMIYPWLYQFIDKKVFLFKKDCATWSKGVHESLNIRGEIFPIHDIKVFHYGYCRGQAEVLKRWQLYKEIEGVPNWYEGTDPDHIIEDRISVCQNYRGGHPVYVQKTLEELFSDTAPFRVAELPRYSMSDGHVGLLLLTYNDIDIIKDCIESLVVSINYPTVIYCLDQGSTDGSYEYLDSIRETSCMINSNIKSVNLEQTKPMALSKAMNKGFKYLMSRQECDYIGWIHPDTIFTNNYWLRKLVEEFNAPDVGKVSAYNLRDGIPRLGEIYEGHEQCYLIKRGVLYQVGLFDEQYLGIGGYEDWDLNNRIRNDGFRTIITTNSQVYHAGMGTRGKRDNTFAAQYNKEYYTKKWGKCEESL